MWGRAGAASKASFRRARQDTSEAGEASGCDCTGHGGGMTEETTALVSTGVDSHRSNFGELPNGATSGTRGKHRHTYKSSPNLLQV